VGFEGKSEMDIWKYFSKGCFVFLTFAECSVVRISASTYIREIHSKEDGIKYRARIKKKRRD
jgi:hypothetical protein